MDEYREIIELLQRNNVVFSERGNEILSHCVFNDCDADSRRNEAHLYINRTTGVYFCHKCNAKGNMVTLRRHYGIGIPPIAPKVSRKPKSPETVATNQHNSLTDPVREYLRNERLLTDDVISSAQIGVIKKYGRQWINIPVRDRAGNLLFMKLRQNPFNPVASSPKYMSTGGESYIYNAEVLAGKPETLVICEGEFDCLALKSRGIPAICSTAGASTFKDEWLSQLAFVREFYVVMDNDDAGRDGAKALIEKLSEQYPSSSIMNVVLPAGVGEHGDITDYFKMELGTVDDLFTPKGKYVTLAAGNEPIDVSKFGEMTLDDVADVLSLTIKHDFDNKIITFLCMLSAYTDESQLNVSFNAPSSSGKTFITTEVSKLFPVADKIELSGASPTSFYHGEGVYDKERQAKIVSLERKILLLYEQPNPALQEKLRAVLSHDSRELQYRITNKDKKGAQRAELIIIRGFPATVFCSAGMQLDEQEATRAILLSPEVTDQKLRDGVTMQAIRGANADEFDSKLDAMPERIDLKNRIIAIKREHVMEIIVEDPEVIIERFSALFNKPKPRHMCDMGHLIRLIKVIALLNVWQRRQSDGTIVANKKDVDQAFELWGKVIESQDMNVPPAVMRLYKQYVLPAYEKKAKEPQYSQDMKYGRMGLSSSELGDYYLATEGQMLSDDIVRKQVLPQLIAAGMITYEQPSMGDRRSKHMFPKWFPDGKNTVFNSNYIGTGGVEISQEMFDLMFDPDTNSAELI